MSTHRGGGRPAAEAHVPSAAARAAERVVAAMQQLTGGLATALLASAVLFGVILVAVACLVGVGLLAVPMAIRAVGSVADRERDRLGGWGPEVLSPLRDQHRPSRLRAAAADRTVRRELAWLACHATVGLFLGVVGVLLPLLAVRDLGFPLYWWALPDDPTSTSIGWGTAHGWSDVVAPALLGVVWVAAIVGLVPGMAAIQALPGRRLLGPGPDVDLSMRVAQLSATRAAALDAHAAELRRIERSLHDGTQNRVVAVTVLLGAARRAVAHDPSTADDLLERAQFAAEQALGELRAVVRSILPPVLDDRGLAEALTGLAATCPVPCRLDVGVEVTSGRCAASVEATAYFVAAEALTNAARHARAGHVTVTVRHRGDRLHLQVTDDGVGGATEGRGSGLVGIRRRVEAHDGVLFVTSPPGGPTMVNAELPCGS